MPGKTLEGTFLIMLELTPTISQRCSRASCEFSALWQVNWRNPRIHSLNRVKIWLACDLHCDFLRDYLEARDFPVAVTELGVMIEQVGSA